MSTKKPTQARRDAFVLSTEIEKPFDLLAHFPYRIAIVSNLLILDRDPLIRYEMDLDARSIRVLLNIGSYSPITAADVAYQSRLDPYSVTRAINDLTKRGLVKPAELSVGRAKPVMLSDEGVVLYRKLVELIEFRTEKLLAGLENDDIERLKVTLAAIEHNAEAMLAEHGQIVESKGEVLLVNSKNFFGGSSEVMGNNSFARF
ncbi:MarR family winged helix-turn-helix transcriptional regulator [Pseudoalteromonas xiamenensis]|uniref:MarR family winged helix-turn-helix transcriptional regulator n=1 Tax=Pseudoalteromonas xiamenensis TaxID=882626 RepID=UPI0027E58A6E|nr:MarR family winged helix-turn-helix transcriptional regulator [Pseudoalteromonas xiamenensis]WMN59694.1 MarR family winged helix-turn-helix transcriptional regulator [Pseudoalteromonas xiamenensis]